MVVLNDRTEVNKNRLLYDPAVLEQHLDEHGSPLGIKLAVKTRATQYELRTAIRFWFGGSATHRTSDRIWSNCEAFENGEWELNEQDEIVYA